MRKCLVSEFVKSRTLGNADPVAVRDPRSDTRPLFEDSELANELFDAIEVGNVNPSFESSAFEGKAQCIERSRKRAICTLNEFREHLGLAGTFRG